MKMNYISKIRANLGKYKTIHTMRRSDRIIDGSYNSVYKGRGMNFDDLREYVLGDSIKDVDWKASARSRKLLIREYIVEKRHSFLFVMDSNRRMLADSDKNEEKRNLLLLSAGTIGYLVASNGDYVADICTSDGKVDYFPFKTGMGPLEVILNRYHNAVSLKNYDSLNKSLEFIVKNIHRRMIIVIATDATGLSEIDDSLLRQLTGVHDVLAICATDADLGGRRVLDFDSDVYLPPFFTKDKKLVKLERERKDKILAKCEEKLIKHGIASVNIGSEHEICGSVIKLLEKHKRGR